MARTSSRRPLAETDHWLSQGLLGGLVAGLTYLLYWMAATALIYGLEAVFRPLRMIGAIVQGPAALEADYPLEGVVLPAILVHGMLSALFGAIFEGLVLGSRPLALSRQRLVRIGIVYGVLLWLLNYYVAAPAFAWQWFEIRTDPLLQLTAHGLAYGAVLGLWLDRSRGGSS